MKMILNSEIIIYCGALANILCVGEEIFSKDFTKKDHDNNQEKIEVRSAHELRDDMNLSTLDLQISLGARKLSSLMRMALGHA